MVILTPEVKKQYPWNGHFIDVSGGKMHYIDEGSGPVFLMVHGNPTWSFYYRRLIDNLSKNNRVIAIDHIGCGLSDKPSNWTYQIDNHINNLCLLIDKLELKNVTLVAHDWGGAIGYGAAIRRSGVFNRFIIMNTAAFLLPLPFILRSLRLPGFGSVVVQGLNGFLHLGMLFGVGKKDKFTPEVREGYFAPYQTWNDRIAIRRFIEEIPIEKNHSTRTILMELEKGLPSLMQYPHLLIWGLKDIVFHQEYLNTWRKWIPESSIHVFPEASHWVLEEEFENIVPLLQKFIAD